MADKAVILGVNSYKSSSVPPLRGCVNDVENLKSVLTSVFGFDPKNIRTFTDEKVVKTEVQKQMKWLFQNAKAGDRLVLHLSSHGSYVADLDGDEDDGRDEIFCLYDMDFHDRETYIVDDEFREWTQTKPDGVNLTVVLDTCHSGTGTRMLMAPDNAGGQRSLWVDDSATLKRSVTAFGTSSRGLEMAAAAMSPDSTDLVRVRYIEPPEFVKQQIEQARSRAKPKNRGFVEAPLNHVLLAGCRDDQTSADATIDGKPNGAFTYHLCKVLRESGAGIARRTLIDKVASLISDGHFTQVPQLEAADPNLPLFPGKTQAGPNPVPAITGDNNGESATKDLLTSGISDRELLARIVGDGKELDADSRSKALDAFLRVVGGAGGSRDVEASGPGKRTLVYIHGISEHPPGFSTNWWNALHPYTNVYGNGTLGDTRREARWSQLVNSRDLVSPLDEPLSAADQKARDEFNAQVRAIFQDRMNSQVMDESDRNASRDLFANQSGETRDLPVIGILDDFTFYMFNSRLRAAIIAEFTKVVKPLLASGTPIDIISHSWGTVVAYEGLRELEDGGLTAPLVRNFFTVGSALSASPIRASLRPANKDGRKPAMVQTWVNIDAKGDPVGGPMKDRSFRIDAEYLDVPNNGCWFFDAVCAHSSYFKLGNAAVNRDIFARHIHAN